MIFYKYRIALIGVLLLTISVMGIDIVPLEKNTPVSKALYINCLQRTQTQQLLKEYILIGMHNSYKNPKETLKKAIPEYDSRFWQFDSYFRERITDAEHVGYLDKAATIWKESKVLLEGTPTKENALILYKNFHALVKYLGKAKVLAKSSFKAVGMTGGLCRDPLYMSNVYLMKLWGVELPEYQKDMEKFIAHFESNIAKLKSYEGNNQETLEYIKKSEDAFLFFSMMYGSDKTAIPTLISKKADDIFLYISTLKELYGKMLKK